MRKCLHCCLTLAAFVGCLSTGSEWAFAQTVLRYIQVIPEPGRSVRLQPAGADQPIEISSIRSISSPAEIAPDNPSPFTIICPDLTTELDVLPGETFACPEAPVPIATVEVPPPPPIIIALDPQKGKELIDLTPEERKALKEARKVIEKLSIEEQPKQFLLANLYATYELYNDAVTLLEKQSELPEDPAALRLLGTLHLRDMAPDQAYEPFTQALQISRNRDDKEGQALAQYYLAVTFDAQGQYDDSFTQHVREALKLCQELGYTPIVEELQKLLQHAH